MTFLFLEKQKGDRSLFGNLGDFARLAATNSCRLTEMAPDQLLPPFSVPKNRRDRHETEEREGHEDESAPKLLLLNPLFPWVFCSNCIVARFERKASILYR